MKLQKNLIAVATILVMSAGLAGCSGEPSDGDIEAAMQKNLEDTKTQMSSVVGKSMAEKMAAKMPVIVSVTKNGCMPRQPSGFICDIDMEVQKPGANETSKTPAKVSFVESDGNWVMLEE